MNTLLLDEVLDLNKATQLRLSLSERRGDDIAIDASQVSHLGAQCAQVLTAAVAAWIADGAALTFSRSSSSFEQATRLLGLHAILTPEGIRP